MIFLNFDYMIYYILVIVYTNVNFNRYYFRDLFKNIRQHKFRQIHVHFQPPLYYFSVSFIFFIFFLSPPLIKTSHLI